MRYVIRDHSSPLAREMFIEDQHGDRVFRVHGPIVRLRDELRIDDAHGVEQAYIKEPLPSNRRTYEIYRDGKQRARISAIATDYVLDGFDVAVANGESLQARGGMFGPNVTLATSGGGTAAKVHWQHRQAIEVETSAGQDDVLLLATVIAMSLVTDSWSRTVAHNH